jgi:hypothetical protein
MDYEQEKGDGLVRDNWKQHDEQDDIIESEQDK